VTVRWRWRLLPTWLRRRQDADVASSDIDEARRHRREAECELTHVHRRGLAVDAAAATLRRHQDDERDFTALVEEAFMRRSQ
jgi:hypothetical protein